MCVCTRVCMRVCVHACVCVCVCVYVAGGDGVLTFSVSGELPSHDRLIHQLLTPAGFFFSTLFLEIL